MAALSGTFNMAHPDIAIRQQGLRRLEVLAGACRELGTRLITLCTGSRDPDDMWRHHPENSRPEAWRDLVDTMRQAAAIADRHEILLGVEPEVSNVIDSAPRARRLLDEIGSPRLKIVFDAANVFHAGELPKMRELLEEAAAILGPDVALAHAKDLASDGAAGDRAAGTGVLDYRLYLSLLRECQYDGPLILHGLAESEAPAAIAFLQQKLALAGA
jgi:sugar phosphate isomerase/epimerase